MHQSLQMNKHLLEHMYIPLFVKSYHFDLELFQHHVPKLQLEHGGKNKKYTIMEYKIIEYFNDFSSFAV